MMADLDHLWRELGIPADYTVSRKLPCFREADDLVDVPGIDGTYRLGRIPSRQWLRMKSDATGDGVVIFIVSAFRSYDYQAELLRKKLANGIPIEEVLTVVAPPGCSQHHTACAIDIGTPGSEYLEEDFETTRAFDWLRINAARYGFAMSYGRDNSFGFIYEPWHWAHEVINDFVIN